MEIVYIETSVVSHATAWPSTNRGLVLQQQARDWWARERSKYSLVTSQLVLDKASLGDPAAAAERLELLAGIPLIPTDPASGDGRQRTGRSLIDPGALGSMLCTWPSPRSAPHSSC